MTPEEKTKAVTVIVLGAQVTERGMSGSLRRRVEAAAEYLHRHPEAFCITTGGQGADEPCPEGEAAKRALVQMGIAAQRIYAENRSVSTRENLRFSAEIIRENGLPADVLLATQQYHQWRAGKLAAGEGLAAAPLVATIRWSTWPKCAAREVLAILKYLWTERKR